MPVRFDRSTKLEVRTGRRRYELRYLVYGLPAVFMGTVVVFASAYGLILRRSIRSSSAGGIGKLLLFSLDVLALRIGSSGYR